MLTSDSEINGHTIEKVAMFKAVCSCTAGLAGMAVNGSLKYPNIKYLSVCV